MQPVGAYKFRAFISYNHGDTKVAEWLHRALESYRIPKRLIGRQTATGEIGARPGAVFRDRDELPVSADLSGKINEALAASQFLVVLCSTRSAKSKWVNQEVVNFKRLRGPESIIAVIVDGEPGASAIPGREHEECFVPGLRFQIGPDGNLTDTPAEPIAADLRPGKDPKKLVRMKVLAGLLAIGLDELIRRDNQRRQRVMAFALAASLAGLAVMGALTWNAVVARGDAERRRVKAEELIEFMIVDLKRPLMEVGRLEKFDQVVSKALTYYDDEKIANLTDESLGRRARVLHLLAETKRQQGNQISERNALNEAYETTKELLRRDNKNIDRMREHSQSAGFLGRSLAENESPEEALPKMLEYLEISRVRNVLMNDDANSLADLARAEVSLGGTLLRNNRAEQALEYFKSALETYRKIELKMPGDAALRIETANALAASAEAEHRLGHLGEALRLQTVALSEIQEVAAKWPSDRDVTGRLVVARRKCASLFFLVGDIDRGIELLHIAMLEANQLLSVEPSNEKWSIEHSRVAIELVRGLIVKKNRTEASAQIRKHPLHIYDISASHPFGSDWRVVGAIQLRLLESALAFDEGDYSNSLRNLDSSLVVLGSIYRDKASLDLARLYCAALLMRGDIGIELGEKDSKKHWELAKSILSNFTIDITIVERAMLMFIAQRLNDTNEVLKLAREIEPLGHKFPNPWILSI